MSTLIFNIENHSEIEESLEVSFDKEERTDKTHTEEKDFSDSRTEVPITLELSHTEQTNKPSKEEPIDKNLHFHFELIIEPTNPTEETKSNGDTIAEEHFDNTEIQSADRRANLQKNFLLDKKESTLHHTIDCPDMLNHYELKQGNEFKRSYFSTYQRCRQITSKAHEHRNRFKLGRPINTGQKTFLENHAQDLTRSQKLKQLRVGQFTVTKQITNTTYEIREDANPTTSKLRTEITSSNTSRKKNDSLRLLLTTLSSPEALISINI